MRTLEYRREKREEKINKRRNLILQAGRHDALSNSLENNKHYQKLDAAVHGDKPGLLAKHDYGALTYGKPRKTKTRKACASYRHKGGYGPALRLSTHDRRQMDTLTQ